MSNVKFFIVFGLVVAGSCPSHETTCRARKKGRIVNGQDASYTQFSYFAVLQQQIFRDREHGIGCAEESGNMREIRVCGGALIGIEWVLTAAHCVIQAPFIEVYLGSIHTDSAEECYMIPSDKISLHPDYKQETMEHDIALIRIPKTTLCEIVEIVPLPKLNALSEHPRYYNEYAVTSGFGMINSEEFSRFLQWARLIIIDNNDCVEHLTDATKNEICARPLFELASPALGDSGGPLVLESTGELVGVTLAVSRFGADKGLPILFARVTNYLEWITSVSGIY